MSNDPILFALAEMSKKIDQQAMNFDKKFEIVHSTIHSSGKATAEEIRQLRDTIKEHNGRLRDVEIEHEGIRHAIKDITQTVDGHKEKIIDTQKLAALNRMMDWIYEHPIKAVTILFSSVIAILISITIAVNIFFHFTPYFEKYKPVKKASNEPPAIYRSALS